MVELAGVFVTRGLFLKINPEFIFLLRGGGLFLYFILHRSQLLSILAGFEFIALLAIIRGIALCKLGTYARIVIFILVTFLVCGGRVGLGLLVRSVRWGGKLNLSCI